jgi:hypothetical protein
MKVTEVIWDMLLLSPSPSERNILCALAILIKQLKFEVLRCTNMVLLVGMMRERAHDVHEYDVYLGVFHYYKEEPMLPLEEEEIAVE